MATGKVKIRLQGHEKFALREGWISKALMILPNNPDAFTQKYSTDLFGIGSNMVKSLRYWMRVLGLTNTSGNELTELGMIIAEKDPYIEKPFTLWIMHSKIAKNIEDATTWYMYFNKCDATDLDKTEIESILLREVEKYAGTSVSKKSLSNDVDVLLNMYSRNKDNSDPEDKNISPFTQLALIKKLEGKYIKNRPNKKIFSEFIVLYELANMIKSESGISIEDVVFGEKGLAKIYNLTSVMANDYFDRLEAAGYIRVDRTAGLDMIYSLNNLNPNEIVKKYYENC